MLFRYHQVRMHHTLASLGGRTVRPRPLVDVAVLGPSSTSTRTALLDTGADITLFTERLATLIGIDLTSAPSGRITNPAQGAILVRYAPVLLRLTDGQEFREWPATVGFTPAPLGHPILGFAGCLQYFTATFHGDREAVELTVNRLYPGT